MEKAFIISRAFLLFFLSILVLCIFSNLNSYDYILQSTSPSAIITKPFILIFREIDFILTIISLFTTTITYIGKELFGVNP